MKLIDLLENDDPFEERDTISELPLEKQLAHWKNIIKQIDKQIGVLRNADRQMQNSLKFERIQQSTWNAALSKSVPVLPPGYQALELPIFTDNKYTFTVMYHGSPKEAERAASIYKQRAQRLTDQFKALEKYLRHAGSNEQRLKRTIRANLIKQASTDRENFSPEVATQIPLNQIPQKLSTTGKGGFTNPYFIGTSGKYAGDPRGFNFTPQMLILYSKLQNILKKHNVAPINVIYGSVLVRSSTQHRNFAAIGGDGKFIWRKYDPAPGAGMNWVIMGKTKINTSDFIGMDDNLQRQYLDHMNEV